MARWARIAYDAEFMSAVHEIGSIRARQCVGSEQCKEYLEMAWIIIKKFEGIQLDLWRHRIREEAENYARKRA